MSDLETIQSKDEPPAKESDNLAQIIKREIKTYVLRAGRMTAAQQKAYDELAPSWCIPFEKKLLNFVDVFGNTNPIIVEIGFGMGDATVALAEANPKIKKRDLKNLFIIEYDALEVLEFMIGDKSINGIHIFFPDPWPKKRHHKRRMVQRPRTNLFAKKLAPDGYLYFVTDWLEYAEFALEELTATKGLKNKYEGFAEPQPWRNQTKFERKGLANDRPITEIFFEKK